MSLNKIHTNGLANRRLYQLLQSYVDLRLKLIEYQTNGNLQELYIRVRPVLPDLDINFQSYFIIIKYLAESNRLFYMAGSSMLDWDYFNLHSEFTKICGTYELAYYECEKLHYWLYGGKKYSNYGSFRVCKSKSPNSTF